MVGVILARAVFCNMVWITTHMASFFIVITPEEIMVFKFVSNRASSNHVLFGSKIQESIIQLIVRLGIAWNKASLGFNCFQKLQNLFRFHAGGKASKFEAMFTSEGTFFFCE